MDSDGQYYSRSPINIEYDIQELPIKTEVGIDNVTTTNHNSPIVHDITCEPMRVKDECGSGNVNTDTTTNHNTPIVYDIDPTIDIKYEPMRIKDEQPTSYDTQHFPIIDDIKCESLLVEIEPTIAEDPREPPTLTIESTDQSSGVRVGKRTRTEENWKKTIRKRARNSGEAYCTTKGEERAKKQFKNIPCGCKKKCDQKFAEDERRQIFESFWQLAHFVMQNIFIRSSVQAQKVSRKRKRDGTGREHNAFYLYSLRSDEKIEGVCKKYFLDTLQVSHGRVYRCISRHEVCAALDARGRRIPNNKIDDSDVVAHIKSFPAFKTRKNADRKYLNPELNIRKMYDLYCNKCEGEGKEPLKQKFYYHVFSSKFNLHFKPPPEVKIQTDFDTLHLLEAEQARNSLKTDEAAISETCYVATFGLEKALPYPKLSTPLAYYKRNIYAYCLSIHSFNKQNGYMYVWDETEGGRGPQEVASALVKHIKEQAKNYPHVIIYSAASCKPNIKLSATLMNLVQDPQTNLQSIDHKFVVHSNLSNFGIIEARSRKCSNIYTPDDWVEVMKGAKIKNPFEVTKLTRQEILSTKELEEMLENEQRFKWLDMKWMRYDRNEPWTLQFKTSFSLLVGFSKVCMATAETIFKSRQKLLYEVPRVVTAAKKNDVLSLLPFIPPLVHKHFKNLRTNDDVDTRLHNNQQQDVLSDDDTPLFEDD